MNTQPLSQTGQMMSCVVSTYLYGAFHFMFGAIALSYPPPPPFCFWWLIMKKRGWKLYRSPNPGPRGVWKCYSAMFLPCGFTLKHECDMIRTYSQMHHTDKYSQHSLIIWPFWLNGWVYVYELSGAVSSSPVAVT